MKTLLIQFRNTISQKEIPQFRGAIIHTMNDADILFHNHEDEKFRYAYPLIQYKQINKCAAILCVDEGTEAIGEFFSNCNFDVSIGSKAMNLQIKSVKAYQTLVQIWSERFHYSISKWLPLNQENYQQYRQLESLTDKYAMLEKILVGNILSFTKGVNIHLDSQVICKITDIDKPYSINYKGIKMIAFNASFISNVSLPDYLGLGKGVSLGNGIVLNHHDENRE
ncbi:MAG: CRISPR-associated endonuclease Cas6 [Parabacteroides sp.]